MIKILLKQKMRGNDTVFYKLSVRWSKTSRFMRENIATLSCISDVMGNVSDGLNVNINQVAGGEDKTRSVTFNATIEAAKVGACHSFADEINLYNKGDAVATRTKNGKF